MRTSETECIESLQKTAERLDKSPTKAEYDEFGLRPASTTIKRVFGSWNSAKEAAELETFTQGENGGQDVQPKPEWVDIPEDVVWQNLTAQQRWYHKNREHRINVKESRRRDLHRWLYELKRDEMACIRCGEERPPALDFHHTNEKERSVSEMVNDGYSKASIRDEIARCLVLCANCHRREHYDGPEPSSLPAPETLETEIAEQSGHDARAKRREWLTVHKREQDGCRHCSVSDPVCLEFHHEGEKRNGVGRLVAHDHRLSEVRDEIEKCRLVCANCHRELHFSPPSSAYDDTHK
jgi:hypothetical protein